MLKMHRSMGGRNILLMNLLRQERFGIGFLMVLTILRWGLKKPKRFLFFPRIISKFLILFLKRVIVEKTMKLKVPTVLAISPTMRCNYDCIGCYSRDRGIDNELSSKELDSLFNEAEKLGIPSVVVTGGEPFSRGDLLPIMEKHRNLLFIVITNGSLLSQSMVKRISASSNIIILVSIEGLEEDTDGRRGSNAYKNAIKAMNLMKSVDGMYGFAATNTSKNYRTLTSDQFINKMVSLGCTFGFFTEYVPYGDNPRYDWIMSEDEREELRETVIGFQKTKPLIIIQFPHDEYGKDNICSAAGRSSFHINSQGDVEPCPFSPYSCDNVRNGGLRSACKSQFLKSIRDHQELLKRKEYACSLFEHREEISKLRDRFKGDVSVKVKI